MADAGVVVPAGPIPRAPLTGLPLRGLRPEDGWCDDAADEIYNRPVKLPFRARAERLWREDGIYDLIVVLGYNDDPPVPGMGSAVSSTSRGRIIPPPTAASRSATTIC